MPAAGNDDQGMQIGETLKGARTGQGLDIRTVEERTKIRIKYLRALEGEDWGALPNPAYAKGFLRTYAQLLGLDGEALVDAYRRQVESTLGPPTYPAAERVLERRRRRPGQTPPRGPGSVLIVAGAAVAAILLVLGLIGGDDEGEEDRAADRREARAERRKERRQEHRREARRERQEAKPDSVKLELAVRDAISVCLLGDGDQPLIDGQVLAAGTREGPYEAERFQLRFPSGYDRGQFRLLVNGEKRPLPEIAGANAYRIVPSGRVKRAREPGLECP